ncbi:MAG: hypothetical protein H7235_08410 [Bdellovibrionaceae bacterium]|nr:hypothetical protein [Pseudobdellovibrionaceae bacterium]
MSSKLVLLFLSLMAFSSCGIFDPRPESPDQIIEKASHQKIFLAPYDQVWKVAHTTLKYTIASENQDFGTIETDFVKAVDGWVPPYKKKPDYPGARYKLLFTFAKGETKNRESTRVTIEKKIEVFKNIISDTQSVPSDGSEEKSIFYRMERELIVSRAIEKANQATK